MERLLTYSIHEQESTLRIEQFLRRKGYSRQNLTELKKMNCSILVNGAPCRLNEIVAAGDVITIHIQETCSSPNIVPVDLPLDIVYEDKDIIVLNKLAGMPIHPSANNYKNSMAGDVTPASGTISAPLSRKPGSIIERTVDYEIGEAAVTHYHVLETKNGHSLVSLQLETGRTHQIRIHLKHLGFPLIGDYLYNPDMEHIQRQALHSHKLSLYHPITGEHLTFIAPLPKDMSQVLTMPDHSILPSLPGLFESHPNT